MKVVIAGQEVSLGVTEVSPTIGITDYSRRETDDFGVTTVVERGFARRMSVRFALPFDQVDGLQQRLAALRASAARWIADDRFGWLDFEGFYKDFQIDLALPPTSFCTLTVEGFAETEAVIDTGDDPAPVGRASSLQLLQPAPVTDSVLLATNVPEVDHAEWSAAVSYPLGARVLKSPTHRVYESAAANNIGNDPAGVSGKWIDIGPTNAWAMFDEALGTFTTAADVVEVVLLVSQVNAIALLDTVATSIRVEAAGYDQTRAVGAGTTTFLDLPLTTGEIVVTIAGGGMVKVGTLLAGRVVGLGVTEAAPTAGINDFSRKDVDDFGEISIVERAWAKRMSARALIRTDALDLVANRVASVRARPSLWIGDAGVDCLTVYGFFRDFAIEVGENVSTLSLSIEGLSKAAPPGPHLPPTYSDGTPIDDLRPAQPDATNGADLNSPLGPDGTVGDSLDAIQTAKADITALIETYGDTASASASAAAASASASTAQGYRDTASAAAPNAANANSAAQAAKTSAQTAASDALARAGAAAGSASAAAGSATTASNKADEALGSASAAAGSATVAATKAGEASTSASNAATSASGAAGSASSAATSATTAASAGIASRNAASAAFPSDFSQGGRFFTNLTGDPATAPDVDANYPGWVTFPVTGKGKLLRFSAAAQGYLHVRTRNLLPATPGRRYRTTVRVRQNANPASGQCLASVWFYGLQPDYTTLVYPGGGGFEESLPAVPGYASTQPALVVADGVVTLALDVIVASNPTCPWITPQLYFYNTATGLSCGQPEILSITVEDVTDSAKAAGSAVAAATSATNAAASQSAAGSNASAAQQSATNAATSAGAAQTSASNAGTAASNASTSETNAAGSAATASSAASNAANSATQAGGSATAAAGSASTAGTHATNAGNSATAASASQVAAQSAYASTVLIGGNQQFDAGIDGWGNNYSSTNPPAYPAGWWTLQDQFEGRPNVIVNNNLRGDLVGLKKFSIDPLRKYRFKIGVHIGAGSGSARIYAGIQQFDGNGNLHGTNVGARYVIISGNTWPAGSGWVDVASYVITGESDGPTYSTFLTGTKKVRLIAWINYDYGTVATAVDYLTIEDVTDSENAAASASAAATSASSAATSSSAAGTSATAAQNSATAASVSAGNAASSASSASGSASAASSSASSAASNATLAANHSGAAASSASAAANSATNASGSASSASSSASTAASHASAASGSATAASNHASTANAQASIATAQASAAQQSAVLSATVASAALNLNPVFADWTSGSGTLPGGWTDWTNGYSNTRDTGTNGPYAFTQAVAANTNIGILQAFPAGTGLSNMPAGWYVIEVDVELLSGVFTSAGILVTGFSGATIETEYIYFHLATELPTGTTGRIYRVRKLVQFNNANTAKSALYLMSGWAGFTGVVSPKTIRWHKAAIRAATDQEIASQAATTAVTALSATVATHSGVLANLNGRTEAYLEQIASTGGATAKVRLRASNGAGGTTSSVEIEAERISLAGASGGLKVVGGAVEISGKLNAVGGVVVSPDGRTSMDLNQNRIVFDNGTFMKVTGVGFGTSGQFIEWFGPKMALNLCSEANGSYWLKLDGAAYFGGTLAAGTLKNAVSTTSESTTANVTTGSFGSNGGPRIVTLSYSYSSNQQITGACPATPAFDATVQLFRGTDATGVYLTTLNVTSGEWSCSPGSGEFEPGGWTANMGGSLTYTDNSGGATASYFARLIGRTAPAGSSLFQSISLVSIEE